VRVLTKDSERFNVQGGSIEVKATQNYASYAFISKDYAKFRKETNYFVRFISAASRLHINHRASRVARNNSNRPGSETTDSSQTIGENEVQISRNIAGSKLRGGGEGW